MDKKKEVERAIKRVAKAMAGENFDRLYARIHRRVMAMQDEYKRAKVIANIRMAAPKPASKPGLAGKTTTATATCLGICAVRQGADRFESFTLLFRSPSGEFFTQLRTRGGTARDGALARRTATEAAQLLSGMPRHRRFEHYRDYGYGASQ